MKWVRSSYYPSYKSELCEELEAIKKKLAQNPENKKLAIYLRSLQERITGSKYNNAIKKEELDKGIYYRVGSIKYYHYYVGHYDPEVYKKQMKDYRNHKRKSRPNGRKWCKVPVSNYHLLVAKKRSHQ